MVIFHFAMLVYQRVPCSIRLTDMLGMDLFHITGVHKMQRELPPKNPQVALDYS